MFLSCWKIILKRSNLRTGQVKLMKISPCQKQILPRHKKPLRTLSQDFSYFQ